MVRLPPLFGMMTAINPHSSTIYMTIFSIVGLPRLSFLVYPQSPLRQTQELIRIPPHWACRLTLAYVSLNQGASALMMRDLADQHIYPARPWDATSEGQQIGILRIVTKEGTRLPQYVWRDYTAEEIQKHEHTSASYYSYPKMATVYRHEALIVGFLPSSTPHQIGCLVSRIEAEPANSADYLYGMNFQELKSRLENSHYLL